MRLLRCVLRRLCKQLCDRARQRLQPDSQKGTGPGWGGAATLLGVPTSPGAVRGTGRGRRGRGVLRPTGAGMDGDKPSLKKQGTQTQNRPEWRGQAAGPQCSARATQEPGRRVSPPPRSQSPRRPRPRPPRTTRASPPETRCTGTRWSWWPASRPLRWLGHWPRASCR